MRQNIPSGLILLTMLFLYIFTGCKKAETNPCEGLLNESPPSKIIVKFIDKQTSEPLNVDAALIKITEQKSGDPYINWGVYNVAGFSPLNGAVSLVFFNEIPGQYQYSIEMGSKGTVTLSYQVRRAETDNPCRPNSYPISDIKITNQPFEQFNYEGVTHPNILQTAL
ncbi:hypothetical protein [Dyadobacter sp. CY356]|uniref:hypothetical protein n=1 Tax=Dyadobacter sp. CY356 TaxID=2906442 RepID=UPI001F2137B8|nr:hypothetical protein [Dyadobacter sp. CY356]MCF0055222.1 hypothetical protein [Dyadobacter sp. CY356]